MKNLLLATDCSVMDDKIGPPPTHIPTNLGALLDLVAERLESGGVLALSGETWSSILHCAVPDEQWWSGRPEDEWATEVTAGSWTARVQPEDIWIRWTRDDRSIWTVDLDVIEPGGRSAPLIHSNPIVTAMQLHRWTETTGHNWIGTPGMTGSALLVDGWGEHRASYTPRWQTRLPWPYGDIEVPYTPMQWYREYDGPIHGYDANKAYLSSLVNVELPADDLQHRRRPTFDPKEGGVWRVDLAPWHRSAELPDPAGYGHVQDDGTRWLTTPTMTLIHQLAERGDHMGYTTLESWTAPARRITRHWAQRLSEIIALSDSPLPAAAGRVYKETYGMWRRQSGRVRRPDWHYATVAMARANLWRKMDKFSREQHRYPVRIETDALFYPTAPGTPWADAAPGGMRLDPSGKQLGAFKPVPMKETP